MIFYLQAAKLGFVEDLVTMLQISYYKERINYPDKDNYTMMHYAARHDHAKAVDCLIQYGSGKFTHKLHDLKEMQANHNVQYIYTTHDIEILKPYSILDVNAKGGRDAATPLHLAAQHNAYHAAEILLMYDVDIDAEDKNKSTPLHRSCQYNNTKMIKVCINTSIFPTISFQD